MATGKSKVTVQPNYALRFVIRHLNAAKEELEAQIGATPTGERRNELCDANIHVQAAIDKIIKGSSANGP